MSPWRHLFIAGASRSGTTLLMNLLDGHPDVTVFPMEHKVFVGYFNTDHARRPEYLSGEFIEKRSSGQQTILASQEFHDAYRLRMQREFGIDFFLDIDHSMFLETYRKHLGLPDPSLRSVVDALIIALAASNHRRLKATPSCRYAVFKDPFTTEFFAQKTAAELPDCRFLHLVRNPYARYCSVKRRNIRTGRYTRREFVKRVYFRDFVTGLAEQSVASLGAAFANRDRIGRERYRVIRFEDLVANTRSEMQSICSWLEVPFHEQLTAPSKLGETMESGSSFAPTSSVDAGASTRWVEHFEAMTSRSERDTYSRYMSLSEFSTLYDLIPPESGAQRLMTWLIPYKKERVRDYLWRVLTRQGRIRGSSAREIVAGMKHRLPNLIAGV